MAMDGCNSVYAIYYTRRCSVFNKAYTFIYDDGNGDCTPLIG